MRRQRIKASANLNLAFKRKKTLEQEDLKSTQNIKGEPSDAPQQENTATATDEASVEIAIDVAEVEELEGKAVGTAVAITDTEELQPDSDSFKCPPKVEYNRIASQIAPAVVSAADEVVFHSDMESDVIQMDLLRSKNYFPMSPSKLQSRQRIRATPIFGQRRNSFVASSPSPHTEEASSSDFVVPSQRRERHYSASQSQSTTANSAPATSSVHHYYSPHKIMPSMGRIRTESGCSAFSDTSALPSGASKRKHDEYSHRVSSRREFAMRFDKGVPEKSALKMFDLIYYNPQSNPMEIIPTVKKEGIKTEPDTADNKAPISRKLELEPTANAGILPVPQLKLNSNGELILDDKSLEIETTAEQEARKVLANSSLLYLDENTGMNGFYNRKKRTKEWPPEETVKFYRCLQTIGTDFSLMCQLFPQRTRRDLKLKFKKEERCNDNLINKALLYPKTFNVDELREQLDTEEREREEAERKWKDLKAKAGKAVKKTSSRGTSAAARSLTRGDDIYRNENVLRSNLRKRCAADATTTTTATITTTTTTPTTATTIITCTDDSRNTTAEVPVKPPSTIVKKHKRKRIKATTDNSSKAADHTKTLEIKSESSIKTESNEQRETRRITTIDGNAELEQELTELLNNSEERTAANTPLPTDNPIPHWTTLGDADAAVHVMQLDGNGQVSTLTPLKDVLLILPPDNNRNKTIINLDDGGSVTPLTELNRREEKEQHEAVYNTSATTSTTAAGTATAAVATAATEELAYEGRELNAADIQQILLDLAEGTLVLVSTLDEANGADREVNEIYMMDKASGELCERPLDIPEKIVNRILTVMCPDDEE